MSVSKEWVDELKELGGSTKEFIFYKWDENVYAENQYEKYCIAGESISGKRGFINKSYQLKKEKIMNIENHFVKTDVKNIKITHENINAMYKPSFSSSTSSSTVCSLYHKKGQGNYALCWAACVATIRNYRKGTNSTAKEVADAVDVAYDEGAPLGIAHLALNNLGVAYNKYNHDVNNRMSWSSLKSNINGKFPVYVDAKAPVGGHAVVAYGYTVAAGTTFVILWNPGGNNGTGNVTSAEFSESGTTFTYNNKTWTWTYSISKK